MDEQVEILQEIRDQLQNIAKSLQSIDERLRNVDGIRTLDELVTFVEDVKDDLKSYLPAIEASLGNIERSK